MYPDRVNAVISLDGGPVKQVDGKYHKFYKLFVSVISFMIDIEKLKDEKGLTKVEAKKLIK